MTQVATDSAPAKLLETIVSIRDGALGSKSLAAVEMTLHRDEMSPLHVHDEDEAYWVLEGSMVIHAGEEIVHLEAGDVYVARGGVRHTHRADSDRVRYLTMMLARSLHLYENFLRAAALPTERPETAAPAEDEAVVAWLARENGIEVLGPPGALP
jgi:quercetin dioxygenase-like cupin family protein